MILPNPSNANEAFVFSRSDYATISIGRGMFVMLRAATKSTIMHVQTHQITMLSTVRSPSILDGLRFARLGSSEFMNVVSARLCGMTCLGVCSTFFQPMTYQ